VTLDRFEVLNARLHPAFVLNKAQLTDDGLDTTVDGSCPFELVRIRRLTARARSFAPQNFLVYWEKETVLD